MVVLPRCIHMVMPSSFGVELSKEEEHQKQKAVHSKAISWLAGTVRVLLQKGQRMMELQDQCCQDISRKVGELEMVSEQRYQQITGVQDQIDMQMCEFQGMVEQADAACTNGLQVY